MNIIWHGQSCFQILATPEKNHQVSIALNPFTEDIGLKARKIEADILLVSREHCDIKAIKGSPFFINGPGEYEIKKVFIQGIPGASKETATTIYTIETEGMRICYLSELRQKELSSDQLEKIGNIDILIIPIGGGRVIDGNAASKIVAQIEPKIVIPMLYQIPGLKEKLETVHSFLKIMGAKFEPLNKLSIKKKSLPTEGMEIVVLKS